MTRCRLRIDVRRWVFVLRPDSERGLVRRKLADGSTEYLLTIRSSRPKSHRLARPN